MIPAALKERVRAELELAVKRGQLTDGLVGEARQAIFDGKGRTWDWDRHWAAHTYFCYTFNFYKAYFTTKVWLKGQPPSERLRILDLGCGAGASTAGAAVAAMETGRVVELTGVDSSSRMMDFFEKTIVRWGAETAKVSVRPEPGDATHHLARDLSRWDLVLCSYLFCGDPLLRRDPIPVRNRLVIDFLPQGISEIECRDRRYGFTFDPKRRLDTSYLHGLVEKEKPQDLFPVVTPKWAVSTVQLIRRLQRRIRQGLDGIGGSRRWRRRNESPAPS